MHNMLHKMIESPDRRLLESVCCWNFIKVLTLQINCTGKIILTFTQIFRKKKYALISKSPYYYTTETRTDSIILESATGLVEETDEIHEELKIIKCEHKVSRVEFCKYCV